MRESTSYYLLSVIFLSAAVDAFISNGLEAFQIQFSFFAAFLAIANLHWGAGR